MVQLIQNVALDIAGLGLLGAGAYCLITGKGGAGAPATLFGLGGTYVGVKVAGTTTATPVTAPATKPVANVPPSAPA